MSLDDEERSVKRQKVSKNESEQEDSSDFDSETEVLNDENDKLRKQEFMGDVYLETINRKVLDFDFEKRCCISLSTVNVYCCLVCGKYYQGRNKSSQAFLHSINEDHHIFMNFSNLKFYILPEDYELSESVSESLNDIRQLAFPSFSKSDISKLDTEDLEIAGLNGKKYKRGFIGMNNIKANDYSNVILQGISHIPEIRNFMLKNTLKYSNLHLFLKLAILIRKIWSKNLYKPHISSHELMQYISQKSKDNFTLHVQKDPKNFLIWLLNRLNSDLVKFKESIISDTCQGSLVDNKDNQVKFWLLSLSLPEITVFKDGSSDASDIPQVNLLDLINKKLQTFKEITHWPNILFLHIDRFSDNKINGINGSDRNSTIVKLPSSLEIEMEPSVKYKLLGNIVYEVNSTNEGDDSIRHFKIQLYDNARNEWVEISDLNVKIIEKELMFIDETYLQIWEKI